LKDKEVSKYDPKIIVVTLGNKGSLVFANNRLILFKPYKTVEYVPIVGASDTFFALAAKI
jgi:fructose-1-phosphate kinase PfkB-like protein